MPNDNQKKIRIKTKAVSKVVPEEKDFFDTEPQELNPEDFVTEDALNEEFDRTYEGKEKKTPLYQKWYFWLALAVVLIALLFAWFNRGKITSPKADNTSTSVTSTTVTTTTEPYYQTITVRDLVVPSGAEVKKGPNGKWGLYDGNQLLTNYNGIASNEYGTWYINNGYVDFNYTGFLVVNGSTYKVNKGQVDVSKSVEITTTTVAGADPTTAEAQTVTQDVGINSAGTQSQQDALAIAVDYINQMAFSRQWLIAQVESDGYNHEDAVWAVDHCGANWNEQAYKKAQEYLTLTTFSKDDMITQLQFEGFTDEQAAYGAEKAGL